MTSSIETTMVDGGAWNVHVGVVAMGVLVCVAAALPTHILLPISQGAPVWHETDQDLGMAVGIENTPTHSHYQRGYQVLPQKRYRE